MDPDRAPEHNIALHQPASASACHCPPCLVSTHLHLADTCARRFRGRGESLEDLTQVARLGLVLASRRFDPADGTPFAGFAVPTMMGELQRHLRDRVWGVRPPRNLQELRPRVLAARDALAQQLHRAPRTDELADDLDLPTAVVAEVLSLDSAYRPDSLDLHMEEARPAEVLVAPRARLDEVEGRLCLEPSFAELPEPNRRVLRLHYIADLPQRTIAAEVGVSQMQVSRILRQSLDRMRRSMGAGQDYATTN